MSEPEELDVLVVGAGFSGLHQLYHLRKLGYTVKIVEAAPGLGGIWYWSRYPGARVDSEVPGYEFSLEELWKEWNWSERYPARDEIIKYFDFVDKKLDIRKDIYFNTRVESAEFDVNTNRWAVHAKEGQDKGQEKGKEGKEGHAKGKVFRAQFLDICVGFGAKPYFPQFAGIEEFKGVLHHTNDFPEGVDFRGKRVAVIGTGASGVQVIQAVGPHVSHLTVFQRTPNLALPMGNYPLSEEYNLQKQEAYPKYFKRRCETFGGISYSPTERKTLEDSEEVRNAFFEKLWSAGNFEFWVGNYGDMFVDEKANNAVYDFWSKKIRARIHNPVYRDLLAPLSPPHFFGTKRPSLETTFYEVFNQPNVSLVDLRTSPIHSFTPSGIRTQDGKEHEVDVVAVATGFDAVTGAIHQIKIKGKGGSGGETLEEKWRPGIKTYLGLSSSSFPNLFFIYNAHGPTALSNGPTCLEAQGEWVVKAIDFVKKSGKERIEAEEKAEQEWSKHVEDVYNYTLFAKTESWYGGANIPGKKRESLCYAGGIPAYLKTLNEKAEQGYAGFVIS